MTKPVQRRRIQHVEVGVGVTPRHDSLAAEEPLEIRVAGASFAVTMRTPGHDFDLVAGFLVSEGVVARTDQLHAMRYCAPEQDENTYNVIDVGVSGPGAHVAASRERHVYTSSSCGVCGLASIDAVATTSAFDVSADDVRVDAAVLAALPDRLREQQAVFERTGGLHAAGLFGTDGTPLVVVDVEEEREYSVAEVLDAIPDGAVELADRGGFDIDDDAFEMTAESNPADLRDQLRLMATKLAAPRWDASPIERLRVGLLTGFDLNDATPNAVLARNLRGSRSGGPSLPLPSPARQSLAVLLRNLGR